MKLVSLSSGSKGNATFICTDTTKVLIDCGISAKKADEGLKALGYSLSSLDAVLLTHEHSDHIKGVKRIMQTCGIPVYATGGTLNNLSRVSGDEYFNYAGRELMEEIYIEKEFNVGDISFLPFRIYHDVAEPCGYRIAADQEGENLRRHAELAVLTDCGHFDDRIADHLKLIDAMLLETNHDGGMLANGPYPMPLKRRIMSAVGHLSNNSAGQLIAEVMSPKLKSILLGHLSHENNTHELALNTVREEVSRVYGSDVGAALDMMVAPQEAVSRIIEI